MVFFFSVTTPFGIALGIGLSNVYEENSPSALITVGLLNASSAGLLIYMALVDLLSADFMGPKLQGSIKLQIKSYVAVLLGAGGMSVMAKWAWNNFLLYILSNNINIIYILYIYLHLYDLDLRFLGGSWWFWCLLTNSTGEKLFSSFYKLSRY